MASEGCNRITNSFLPSFLAMKNRDPKSESKFYGIQQSNEKHKKVKKVYQSPIHDDVS